MSLLSETARYLGYGNATPDERTEAVMLECLEELRQVADAKTVTRRYPLELGEDDGVSAAGLTIHSKNLRKNLQGCSEVIFFAATLGISVDRLLKKYIKLQISKAAVLQAAAAAFLEEYCDDWQKSFEHRLNEEGLYLRPRFSPGYGDFPLTHQADLLKILDAHKKIGLVLTESNMMLPEKSVTAILGVSHENNRCLIQGCEACAKTNCAYRRNQRGTIL